jgi:hypothetical protein
VSWSFLVARPFGPILMLRGLRRIVDPLPRSRALLVPGSLMLGANFVHKPRTAPVDSINPGGPTRGDFWSLAPESRFLGISLALPHPTRPFPFDGRLGRRVQTNRPGPSLGRVRCPWVRPVAWEWRRSLSRPLPRPAAQPPPGGPGRSRGPPRCSRRPAPPGLARPARPRFEQPAARPAWVPARGIVQGSRPGGPGRSSRAVRSRPAPPLCGKTGTAGPRERCVKGTWPATGHRSRCRAIGPRRGPPIQPPAWTPHSEIS